MDLGAAQTVIAAVSVIGFLIFFGSPTALALIQAGRQPREATETETDADALSARARALEDEDVLSRYYLEAFTDQYAVNFVYNLAVIFGASTLSDLLSFVVQFLGLSYFGVDWAATVVFVSLALVILAVGLTMYGILKVKAGADARLRQEQSEVLHRVARFRFSAAPIRGDQRPPDFERLLKSPPPGAPKTASPPPSVTAPVPAEHPAPTPAETKKGTS